MRSNMTKKANWDCWCWWLICSWSLLSYAWENVSAGTNSMPKNPNRPLLELSWLEQYPFAWWARDFLIWTTCNALCTGAAPLYLGRRLGWILSVPYLGMARNRLGKIFPYAAVTHRSGLHVSNASRKSGCKWWDNVSELKWDYKQAHQRNCDRQQREFWSLLGVGAIWKIC